MDTMTNTTSDATSLGQDNVQALMKSGQIWMTGCQSIGQAVSTATQSQLAQMMSGWTAMTGAKSFAEVLVMQKAMIHNSIESAIASTGKITGATMAVVQESMAPVTACMTVATAPFGIKAL